MCSLFVFSYDFTLTLKIHKVCKSFRTMLTQVLKYPCSLKQTFAQCEVSYKENMCATVAVTLDIFLYTPICIALPTA